MALRVLYVDDDPALARLSSRILGRHGMEVVHAASVASGLKMFQDEQFDIVVLDHYFQTSTEWSSLPRFSPCRGGFPFFM